MSLHSRHQSMRQAELCYDSGNGQSAQNYCVQSACSLAGVGFHDLHRTQGAHAQILNNADNDNAKHDCLQMPIDL